MCFLVVYSARARDGNGVCQAVKNLKLDLLGVYVRACSRTRPDRLQSTIILYYYTSLDECVYYVGSRRTYSRWCLSKEKVLGMISHVERDRRDPVRWLVSV